MLLRWFNQSDPLDSPVGGVTHFALEKGSREGFTIPKKKGHDRRSIAWLIDRSTKVPRRTRFRNDSWELRTWRVRVPLLPPEVFFGRGFPPSRVFSSFSRVGARRDENERGEKFKVYLYLVYKYICKYFQIYLLMMYVSQMLNGEWGWPIYLHLLGSCVGKCRLSIYDTWIIFQLYLYIYIYMWFEKNIYIYMCVW